MKSRNVNNIITLGVIAGIAYCVSAHYSKKKQKRREQRETLHFQLF